MSGPTVTRIVASSEPSILEAALAQMDARPHLTDEQIAERYAAIPRCPEEGCGGKLVYVRFQVIQNHAIEWMVDGTDGEILLYTDHSHELEKAPVQRTPADPAVGVECERGHVSNCARARWDGMRERWTVVP